MVWHRSCPPKSGPPLAEKHMAIVYILFSETTNKIYTGSSHENDFSVRLKSHNAGKVRSTKFGKPWKLIHKEDFLTYNEARKRELFLKTGAGRNWIKNSVKI